MHFRKCINILGVVSPGLYQRKKKKKKEKYEESDYITQKTLSAQQIYSKIRTKL